MATLIDKPLPHLNVHRGWTVAEFEKLIDLSFFGPEEKLELIGGELIPKGDRDVATTSGLTASSAAEARVQMTQDGPHFTGIYRTHLALQALRLQSVVARAQGPLVLSPTDRPEPDVALVQGEWEDFGEANPTTALLVVEVSDATLATDQTTKASLYARAGIAEYWIVNINARRLEVRRDPAPDQNAPLGFSYSSLQTLNDTQEVSPLAAPGQAVKVADLLPRPK